ncbi:tRNA lysidine(34) synthetase TilS [Brumimicrobium salinarum]|uniref:tRNA(Ile)-lysidine synthase n=1 Tax=Brumimicrobium salinarum TaxID=2058658 RepID=A0A2I0R281_9FLAO|nr:tRNA lysidine(34) synthetase TilS [Brumimicrobium salinarum]PKR80691.1 tRNA lysidine(34) synthetase TilS [Brumimicrobium salinarum]
MNETPKYWVACSGGVDSVVLLHLMVAQQKEVGVLHCNFHLRKESSNEDETFVRNLAAELNVPIRVREFNTIAYGQDNRINTQLAARELRYNWFDEIIKNENAIVLLAHHYDDQMETFFLQLRRGAKIKGLAGMPKFRNGYLRPLLKHSKKDLIALANQNNWTWREDVTNASNDYSRNWYRNEVIPFFKQNNFPLDDVIPLITAFQKLLGYFQDLKLPTEIGIENWNNLPYLWKQFVLTEHGLGEYSVKEIDKLSYSIKGKKIGNAQCKVWNEGGELVFVQNKNLSDFYIDISHLHVKDVIMEPGELYLDASKIDGPLIVRKWEAGDYFQPLGMKNNKKISKFLRDRKVKTHVKERIQVLVDSKNDVIGVFDFGVSENVKIDENTVYVLHVVLKG